MIHLPDIHQTLELLHAPGDVVELRIPKAGRYRTISGYFDDFEALAKVAVKLNGKYTAVYTTLNPCDPSLMGRAYNRVKTYAVATTTDAQITRRTALLLDADPIRPTGISSTDAEHELALERTRTIRADLSAEGWPEPILADSGNGGHLVYRIDLPIDDDRVQKILQVIAQRYGDETIDIDTSVYNPARISKLYGTMACKGDSTPGRPHRLARLLDVPKRFEVVPIACLDTLIAELPPVPPRKKTRQVESDFDLATWISRYAPEARGPETWNGKGKIWRFPECPWREGDGETAYIAQLPGGAISAGCQHATCPGSKSTGNHWRELREQREPGCYDKPQPAPSAPPSEDMPVGQYNLTDLGNAMRFVLCEGENVRYCHPWGKWLVWDGRRWKIDDTGAVEIKAVCVVKRLLMESANADSQDQREKLRRFSRATESLSKRRALLISAQPYVTISPDELDTDPWLLNCTNGTLDLRTGEIRAPERSDYLTKLAPTDYDPEAECPDWRAFQDTICGGNQGLVAFKQRAFGYGLTGDVSEQIFFMHYGTGSNGKSTELNTIKDIVGPDYAQHTATETLMVKRNPGVPNDVAKLKGARFVTAIESEAGRRMAEALVKQLTGGDVLTARFLYGEFFEFRPTHKLYLAANHKPEIRGTDHAMWRRIRLIPYTVTIPDDEQDKQLPDKLLAEAAGILAWLVQGCLEWQRDGLVPPESVKNATSAYKDEMDALGDFITECCVLFPGAKVTAAELYKAYKEWGAKGGEEETMSKRSFGVRLRERGTVSDVRIGSRGSRGYKGIGLKGTAVQAEIATDASAVTDASDASRVGKSTPPTRDPFPVKHASDASVDGDVSVSEAETDAIPF